MPREAHLVRDDDEVVPGILELIHDVKHLYRVFRVERAGGLVKEEELRPRRRRTGYRRALLLAP